MKPEIESIIKSYAAVYNDFEEVQKSGLLPIGDQKTGVIAEYYAKCYIQKTYGVDATYAKPGESFDLSYTKDGKTVKVQVKAVSAHSKTRTITPLNLAEVNNAPPFDFLYLISLDKNFIPDGFYINELDELIKSAKNRKRITGSIMRGESISGNLKNGSSIYDFKKDKLSQLLDACKYEPDFHY